MGKGIRAGMPMFFMEKMDPMVGLGYSETGGSKGLIVCMGIC
jgi:hypothetical protein